MKKVICISAKARHGKDTAAEILKEYLEHKGQRVLITHYADLLKFICRNSVKYIIKYSCLWDYLVGFVFKLTNYYQ